MSDFECVPVSVMERVIEFLNVSTLNIDKALHPWSCKLKLCNFRM